MTSVIACDVSYFQPPVDDSYPHKWLTFRGCDGSFVDPNAARNLAWSEKAVQSGRMTGYSVYVVYRPGMNDTILSTLDGLGVPARAHVLIDAETWGGQMHGDHSTELNALLMGLVSRQGGNRDLVWGYGNRSDLTSMWPGRPAWLRMVVAAYGGNKPTGIANMVGWQYTDGQPQYASPDRPSSTPPFGRCDHNELYLPIPTPPPEGDDMTPAQEKKLDDVLRLLHIDIAGRPDDPKKPGNQAVEGLAQIHNRLVAIEKKLGIL